MFNHLTSVMLDVQIHQEAKRRFSAESSVVEEQLQMLWQKSVADFAWLQSVMQQREACNIVWHANPIEILRGSCRSLVNALAEILYKY